MSKTSQRKLSYFQLGEKVYNLEKENKDFSINVPTKKHRFYPDFRNGYLLARKSDNENN